MIRWSLSEQVFYRKVEIRKRMLDEKSSSLLDCLRRSSKINGKKKFNDPQNNHYDYFIAKFFFFKTLSDFIDNKPVQIQVKT